MTPVARRYLAEALDVMQHHALNRATLDWSKIREQAMSAANGAATTSDVYAAIERAMSELDDNSHSRFVPAPSGGASSPPVTLFDLPSGRLLPGRIAYLELPGNSSTFADKYQAAGNAVMRRLQESQPLGWVVDLRSDNGGDVWPMLAGIQPLLGSGTIGSFVPPRGPASLIRVTPTALTLNGKMQIRVPAADQQDASPDPVVVLTGNTTASSGEFVAIALRGRPCATSIGAATKGVPTANEEYRLGDGAMLILTVALDADRTGHVYPDAPIRPDIEIGGAANDFATWVQTDAAVGAASRWLRLHSNCHP